MVQTINGYEVTILTAETLGGFPITGKSDAGLVMVELGDDIIAEAWIVINDDGTIDLERA